MCKFWSTFFAIIFQFAPCIGQVELYRGKVDLTKKDLDITNFIILNLNWYIGINVTYNFTAKNITQKVVWNIKHKWMQLVIHLGWTHTYAIMRGPRSIHSAPNILLQDIPVFFQIGMVSMSVDEEKICYCEFMLKIFP